MIQRMKPMIGRLIIIYWVLGIYYMPVYVVLGDAIEFTLYAIQALAFSWLYVKFFSEEEST